MLKEKKLLFTRGGPASERWSSSEPRAIYMYKQFKPTPLASLSAGFEIRHVESSSDKKLYDASHWMRFFG